MGLHFVNLQIVNTDWDELADQYPHPNPTNDGGGDEATPQGEAPCFLVYNGKTRSCPSSIRLGKPSISLRTRTLMRAYALETRLQDQQGGVGCIWRDDAFCEAMARHPVTWKH